MPSSTQRIFTRFYKNGFNTHQQNNAIKTKYPDRFILCGSFDPRAEEAGLDAFRQMVEDYPIQGLKLYTAEWRNGSKGWRLNDPWAYKYFELAGELGVKNIHVHKGPTVYPLNRDAFDVADVDYAATDFPNLNFIIEHIGAAAVRRLLLDCHAGKERLCRHVGSYGVHPFTSEIFRRDSC